MKRIGVLTGGGDAPGLNPAIRAVVYRANDLDIEVVGILDGWRGLLDATAGQARTLTPDRVRTWDRLGGTALGSSRTNPFRVPVADEVVDRSSSVIATLDELRLDGLVAIGGEDTLSVAAKLAALNVPVVGIPKTIDKDLSETDYTLGFDTAVRTVAEAIERSRTPAGSHHWVQVVEVMGRHAGHLAMWSGLAGGANMILIPEYPFTVERVCALLHRQVSTGPTSLDRLAPQYAVVVVAEGARTLDGGEFFSDAEVDAFGHARFGGVGAWLAEQIRATTSFDARAVALGHPQRGGPPSAVDRSMGWVFGVAAVEALTGGRTGVMVSARGVAPAVEVGLVRIADAVATLETVDVARHYDPTRYHILRSVLSPLRVPEGAPVRIGAES